MHEITLGIDQSITETDYLSFLSQAAHDQGFSFALWRLPHSNEKHAVISINPSLIPKTTIIEELEPGFLFAPFDRNQPTTYLSGDFVFTFVDGKLKEPTTPTEEKSVAWLNQFRQADTFTLLKRKGNADKPSRKFSETTEAHFTDIIETGIRAIEQGAFEKIVPSRIKYLPLPDDFDTVTAFQRLSDAYANALISWVSIPETGDWLGATPEVLVCVENGSLFKTVALAGTQPYNDDMNVKHVAWTQKEIEEQALVSRYIISCFKYIRLREYEEHGPKTVVAGNLMHLRTDFTVDLKAVTNFPHLGSTMLQLLHPTSAVCGMPLEPALEFLKQHENYDRGFFAGYLGPVNFNNDIHIFVNLRCMQLFRHEAILYAGAGVTADSIPEKEWMETEMKLQTLPKVIF